jgi:hypothetical protein
MSIAKDQVVAARVVWVGRVEQEAAHSYKTACQLPGYRLFPLLSELAVPLAQIIAAQAARHLIQPTLLTA